MSTIPAQEIVQINPGVLSAGGGALDLVGMFLTLNTRVPIGSVQQFSSAAAVLAYFGPGNEYNQANVYFAGFNTKTKTPGTLNFAQYPAAELSAYLRGGNVSGLTLQQLQAITGTLSIVMDGYTYSSGSVNLSSDNSFSAAAATLQTELNASLPTGASVTAAIAAESASVTASIAGNVMYVTVVGSGTLVPGSALSGTGVTSGTLLGNQLSGTAGGVGTYAVSKSQVVASTTITASYGQMTVSAVGSGTVAVGQTITGSGVTAGSMIIGLGSGAGGTGTYYINLTQTVGSEAITSTGTALAVTYDSVSGAFVVTSGSTGAASSAAFATGSAAASLALTQATGAVTSQGAVAESPSTFMTALTTFTQNFATFLTLFDPDGSSSGVLTQKLAFALWTSQQNDRYAYICWDTNVAPTVTVPATSSLGYALQQNGYSGTNLNWEPSDLSIAAFVAGMTASINFDTPNGRITAAFKSQSGLVAGVTDPTTAINLAGNPQVAGSFGNGYNFYGSYGAANAGWVYYNRGTISGPYVWYDTYINQIWLNNSFLVDLMDLLTTINSIPYNQAGYTLIAESLSGTIAAALNNGVIRAGVTLSANQILEVNTAAGQVVAPTIQSRGWYLQVGDASPSVRQSRGSPPITFWYADGESVQAVSLASIVLQ